MFFLLANRNPGIPGSKTSGERKELICSNDGTCTTRENTLKLIEPIRNGIFLKAILYGMYVRMLDDLH